MEKLKGKSQKAKAKGRLFIFLFDFVLIKQRSLPTELLPVAICLLPFDFEVLANPR